METGTKHTLEQNCTLLARLKKLTKHDILFVTLDELMRGLDYRTDEDCPETLGISLLIMSDLQSQRALIQALGRVGRFGEACRRFVWQGLREPVNQAGNAKIVRKLNLAIDDKNRRGNRSQAASQVSSARNNQNN